MMGPGGGPAAAGPAPTGAGPAPSSGRYGSPVSEGDEFSTTPQARPQRIVPGAPLSDEISTTPQARPERVDPAAGTDEIPTIDNSTSPPASGLDDEISTTPQARPERVVPAADSATEQTQSAPPPE